MFKKLAALGIVAGGAYYYYTTLPETTKGSKPVTASQATSQATSNKTAQSSAKPETTQPSSSNTVKAT